MTGAILGAAQSWGLGRVGPATVRWVLATAGLAVGLGVGAAAVGYGTATGDLRCRARSAAWPSVRPRQ